MKKYFKYFLVFLCIFVMVFCFSGCNGEKQNFDDNFIIDGDWYLSYEEIDGKIFENKDEDIFYVKIFNNSLKMIYSSDKIIDEKSTNEVLNGKYVKDKDMFIFYDLDENKLGNIKILDSDQIVFIFDSGIKQFFVRKNENDIKEDNQENDIIEKYNEIMDIKEEQEEKNNTNKNNTKQYDNSFIEGKWCLISEYKKNEGNKDKFDCSDYYLNFNGAKYDYNYLYTNYNGAFKRRDFTENEFLLVVIGSDKIIATYDTLNDRVILEHSNGKIETYVRLYEYLKKNPISTIADDLYADNLFLEDGYSYTTLTGKIKNNGNKTYYFVKIKGVFKDLNGNVLDTDWTYLVGQEGIAPGEQVSFSMSVPLDENIYDFSLSVIDYNE